MRFNFTVFLGTGIKASSTPKPISEERFLAHLASIHFNRIDFNLIDWVLTTLAGLKKNAQNNSHHTQTQSQAIVSSLFLF